MYFEIKTPEPNRGQCIEMKQRVLSIAALRKGHNAQAFAACAYNPFTRNGAETIYSWGYALQFLELGQDWLVGKDFWATIGEASTYDEICEICTGIGKDIEPLISAVLG